MTKTRSFRTRALVVGAAAATFALAVAGPALSQEAPVTGTGVAGLSIVPADLDILGLPVDVDTSVGTLLAEAANSGDPVARLALAGLAAGGDAAPDLAISSADGDKSGQEHREAGAAGATAALSLVDYAVEAGADTATARLGALAGSITTPLGLGASLDAQQVETLASPTEAVSSVVLTVSGLELALGDLLPADVLDALPLSVVLDLVDTLGLPLSADLSAQIAALEALAPTLHEAVDTAGELAEAEALLAAALAESPAVLDADQAVADAEAAVAAAEDDVAAIEAAIADLEAELLTLDPVLDAARVLEIEAELTTLESDLAAAQTVLAAAEQNLADAQALLDAAIEEAALLDQTLADLLAQVEALEALLADLLAQIDALLADLDLQALLDDLLALIGDTPLLSLGDVVLDLQALATGTASSGTASCSASGLVVLGQAVPTPDCNAISAALDTLDAALTDALSVLPVVGGVVPGVTASGFDVSASGAGAPDENGVTTAGSKISALTIGIAPVELTAVVDDLIAELEALIGDLDAALTEVGLDLPTVLAAGEVQAAVVELPAGLDAALGELIATLDALPTGAALDGLGTLGLDAVLGSVELTSAFTPTAAGAPTTPDTPTTPAGTPTTPGTPTGTTGTPDGSLPRTGLELHTLFMAAIAAAAVGAVTMGLGRTVEMQLQTVDTDGE